jgi:hypothetical protein
MPRWQRLAQSFAVSLLFCLLQIQRIFLVSALPTPHPFTSAGRVAPFGRPEFPPPDNHANHNHPFYSEMITSKCSCGSSEVSIRRQNLPKKVSVVDCHCASCRRFHVTAFVRYLQVPSNDVSVSGDAIVRFQDRCDELGSVQRVHCRRCYSKLLTTRSSNDGSYATGTVHVNMGPLDKKTIPDELAGQWKDGPIQQQRINMAPSWAGAVTRYDSDADVQPPDVTLTGGCTCGACQYEFQWTAPMEIQHCYCYLCRQLSGGPYMSWVPIRAASHKFRWITNGAVTKVNDGTPQRASLLDTPLQYHQQQQQQQQRWRTSDGVVPTLRYTDIGERHVCFQCGGVLSIQYDFDEADGDDAMIWLAAGGFDSIRLPFHIEPYLDYVAHICCRFQQPWYTIPDDDMPRVQDAS